MAEVPYGPFMKTAPGKPPKRVFDNISNKGTTTGPPKKPKKKPSVKTQYVGGWSEADLSSSEPHSDATEESEVARRTYGMRAVLQRRHAPQISKDTEYYDHVEPNAAKAAKARQSGGGLLTFVPTSEQPLEDMPIDGGISHTSHVPEISSDVVGVNEVNAASGALGHEANARKKQKQGKGKGKGTAGVTRAPPFKVWFDGELVGKYEGGMGKAVPDIKEKRPGVYMNERLLSCLLGVKKSKILRANPSVKEAYKVTKFTAKYDSV